MEAANCKDLDDFLWIKRGILKENEARVVLKQLVH